MNYFFIWLGQHDFDNFSIERSIFWRKSTSRKSAFQSNFKFWDRDKIYWLTCNWHLCYTIEFTAFYARNSHFRICPKVKFLTWKQPWKQRFTDIWKLALVPFVPYLNKLPECFRLAPLSIKCGSATALLLFLQSSWHLRQ